MNSTFEIWFYGFIYDNELLESPKRVISWKMYSMLFKIIYYYKYLMSVVMFSG